MKVSETSGADGTRLRIEEYPKGFWIGSSKTASKSGLYPLLRVQLDRKAPSFMPGLLDESLNRGSKPQVCLQKVMPEIGAFCVTVTVTPGNETLVRKLKRDYQEEFRAMGRDFDAIDCVFHGLAGWKGLDPFMEHFRRREAFFLQFTGQLWSRQTLLQKIDETLPMSLDEMAQSWV